MKRLIVLALVLVLFTGMVFAGGGGDKAAGSGGVIRFANYQFGEAGFADFYRYADKEFERQNPGWTVEEVQYPYADYWTKLLADVSAGSPPDVFQGNFSRIGPYRAMGALEPFENYASPELLRDFKTVFLAVNDPPVHVDGKTYALPMMLTTHQLMYNETLLKEAGIAVPKNTAEFIAAAKALTKAPDQYGYAFMTLNEDAFYNDIMMWMMGQDKGVIGGKVIINTPGAVQGMQYYKELFDAGTTPMGVNKATYRNMFAQGRVAMLLDGPWLWSLLQQENPPICEVIKSAAFPAFPTGLSAQADNVLYLASAGKNKATAWKLIEICASKEMQGKFVEYTNTTSGRTDAVSRDWLRQNAWFQGFVDGAAGAIPTTPMDYLELDPQIRKLVIDAGQDILYTNANIKARLDKAQEDIDKLYAAY